MQSHVIGGRAKEGEGCLCCGGVMPPSLGVKPRKYCSDRCGKKYRNGRSCSGCGVLLLPTGRGSQHAECLACREAAKVRRCLRCGSSFTATGRGKYCSQQCSRKPETLRKCGICGITFSQKAEEKYCSKKCRSVARSNACIRRAKKHKCLNCGELYIARCRSRCAFKYCTRECAFEARRLRKKCAERPLESASRLAAWFSKWGSDQWPQTAACGCGQAFVAKASSDSKEYHACYACRNRKDRKCSECGVSVAAYKKRCSHCRKNGKVASRRSSRRRSRSRHGNDATFRQRCKRYGTPYTRVSREHVLSRDKWRCKLCGVQLLAKYTTLVGTRTPHPRSPTIDHIVPLSFGPSSPGHVIENCQAACWACNCERGTEDADSFAARKAAAIH